VKRSPVSPSSTNDVMVHPITVFDIIFCSCTLFPILSVFAIVFHWEENFDVCCTLGE
jgi:hypothetical protein